MQFLRPFKPEDLGNIVLNEYSNAKNYGAAILSDEIRKYTVERDGIIRVIILFREYYPNKYTGGFLISEGFQMPDIRSLKSCFWQWIEENKADRVETDSLDCAILNRWHEYLGFTNCGKKTRYIGDKDYISWEWVRPWE